jgi:hypothetical protein
MIFCEKRYDVLDVGHFLTSSIKSWGGILPNFK